VRGACCAKTARTSHRRLNCASPPSLQLIGSLLSKGLLLAEKAPTRDSAHLDSSATWCGLCRPDGSHCVRRIDLKVHAALLPPELQPSGVPDTAATLLLAAAAASSGCCCEPLLLPSQIQLDVLAVGCWVSVQVYDPTQAPYALAYFGSSQVREWGAIPPPIAFGLFASPNCSKTPALAVLLLACAPVGRHAVQAPKFCCITSCSPSVERYDTGPHSTQRTWPSATTPTQRASSCLTQCCSQCTADGTQVTHTLCPLVMPTHSGPACRTSCSQCFFLCAVPANRRRFSGAASSWSRRKETQSEAQ
jgi:hypothetical protein